jgi:hypothetical protein
MHETFHSEEHLVNTDRGVVLLRSLLKRQVDAVARGDDPSGVMFEGGPDLVELAAGTAILTDEITDENLEAFGSESAPP